MAPIYVQYFGIEILVPKTVGTRQGEDHTYQCEKCVCPLLYGMWLCRGLLWSSCQWALIELEGRGVPQEPISDVRELELPNK